MDIRLGDVIVIYREQRKWDIDWASCSDDDRTFEVKASAKQCPSEATLNPQLIAVASSCRWGRQPSVRRQLSSHFRTISGPFQDHFIVPAWTPGNRWRARSLSPGMAVACRGAQPLADDRQSHQSRVLRVAGFVEKHGLLEEHRGASQRRSLSVGCPPYTALWCRAPKRTTTSTPSVARSAVSRSTKQAKAIKAG